MPTATNMADCDLNSQPRASMDLVHLHRSFYAIEAPVIYSGYETTNLYPTLD